MTGITAHDRSAVIARALCEILDRDFVFIAFALDTPPTRVKATVAATNGISGPQFAYDLAETPCQLVYENRSIFIPCDVSTLFPVEAPFGWQCYAGVPFSDGTGGVIGHIAAFGSKPMNDEAECMEILRLAAKVVSEDHLSKSEPGIRAAASSDSRIDVRTSQGPTDPTNYSQIIETFTAPLSRAMFEKCGTTLFQDCRERSIPLTMLYMSVDDSSDLLLTTAASRDWTSVVNAMSNIVHSHARFHQGLGGRLPPNEFAILFANSSPEAIDGICASIRAAFRHATTSFSKTSAAAHNIAVSAITMMTNDPNFPEFLRRAQIELFQNRCRVQLRKA